MAATRPAAVASIASTVGSRPNRRTAAEVTGLMLAIRHPRIHGLHSRMTASAIAPLVTVTHGADAAESSWVVSRSSSSTATLA